MRFYAKAISVLVALILTAVPTLAKVNIDHTRHLADLCDAGKQNACRVRQLAAAFYPSRSATSGNDKAAASCRTPKAKLGHYHKMISLTDTLPYIILS